MELQPSELGTKSYWDDLYTVEVENYSSNGDEGEIWFGRGCESRVVKWIVSKCEKISHIVDVGCGNGSLVFSLMNNGFSNVVGLDYSDGAVELARRIAGAKGVADQVIFMSCDVLEATSLPSQSFNVAVDKGTFDAISLMEDSMTSRMAYKCSIVKLLKQSTDHPKYFIITSCNWTKLELLDYFDENFDYLEEIEAPQFSFGGKVGQTVTTIIFKLKS